MYVFTSYEGGATLDISSFLYNSREAMMYFALEFSFSDFDLMTICISLTDDFTSSPMNIMRILCHMQYK